MITISNADAALKNIYLEAVNSQLSGEVSPFFNAITKSTDNVVGKDVKIAVANGGIAGVIAGAEDADLPAPRSNRYYGITLPLKNIYGTIEVSDKVIRASGESTGAFINVLNAEMEGLVSSAKANLARMLYGDGNGTLCNIVSKKDKYSIYVNNAKSFFAGLKVIVNTATPIEATVVSVDAANGTIRLDCDLSAASFMGGEKITLGGAAGCELLGLAAIFDSSQVYGFSKSQYSYFAPTIKHIKPSELTEDAIIDIIDLLESTQDSKVDMILCSHSVRKKIAALMSASRRIVNSTEIAAGYSSIVINDVPVYADKFCPENKIFFLNTADFSLNQLCDWSWLEDEGGRVLKQVAGKAAYSATLVKYAELVCKKPCGQAALYMDTAE